MNQRYITLNYPENGYMFHETYISLDNEFLTLNQIEDISKMTKLPIIFNGGKPYILLLSVGINKNYILEDTSIYKAKKQ